MKKISPTRKRKYHNTNSQHQPKSLSITDYQLQTGVPTDLLCDALRVTESDLQHIHVYDRQPQLRTNSGYRELVLFHYYQSERGDAGIGEPSPPEGVEHVKGIVVDIYEVV